MVLLVVGWVVARSLSLSLSISFFLSPPCIARTATHALPQQELLDSLRGASVQIGTIQRRLAWPLRKDDKIGAIQED